MVNAEGMVVMEEIWIKAAMEPLHTLVRQEELMAGPVSGVTLIFVVNALW